METIKTDLFRFVSIRSPQLIDQSKKQLGFIHHPDPSKSHFLSALSNANNLSSAQNKLSIQSKSFTPVDNYLSIQQINPDLYEFSNWLSKHRNRPDYDEANAKANNITVLNDDQINTIWDNLLFQVLQKNKPNVRQACIQLLVTHNFIQYSKLSTDQLQKFADELIDTPRNPLPPNQKKRLQGYIKRIVNAKVVIPKVFTQRIKKSETPKEKNKPKASHPQSSKKINKDFSRLNVTHFNGVIRNRNNRLRTIKKELERTRSSIRPNQEDITLSGLLKNQGDKLSEATKEFINKSTSNSSRTVIDIYSAIGLVQTSLRRESKKILGPDRNGRRAVMARGHLIREKPDDEYCFSLSFLNDELKIESTSAAKEVMYISLNAGYPNAYIKQANYSITFQGSKAIKSSSVRTLKPSGNFIHLQLFSENTLPTSESGIFSFKGQLQLSDGVNLEIDIEGNSNNKYTNGCSQHNPATEGDEVEQVISPLITSKSGVELYGVHNIGVAIYRKVEQEVCCYVPGEVSRIENILAREYKERHTRSLVSTESTQESTSEVEIENLNDTATSERNEIQTEIASVLNQDRSSSIGASLGVSGKAWGMEVSANAHADFTSSNSSSISDSTAKTYAEEVTNRALDRVVQKSSEKRTSKILKEFEENNKHGFDNREGENHVTGVYRWVDIIYTNRLVNYGKRLTYEFMIPEPAFSYKYMLFLIDQEEGSSSGTGDEVGLTEPVHPSQNGINGPDDFDEETYPVFGRLYGITIPAPSPFTDSKTEGVAPPAQPAMSAEAYDFNIQMDPSYQAVSAIVDITFEYKYKGTTHTKTKFDLTIADRFILDFPYSWVEKEGGFRNFNDDLSITFANPWNTSIPVHVSCKNINHFNISVVLNLVWKEEYKTQWQEQAYDLVLKAYEAQLEEYQNAIAEAAQQAEEDEGDESENTHKSFNRSLEQRELQRLCIELMTQPFQGFEIGKFDFYDKRKCRAILKQSPDLEKYASHVKFFEQAFEWDIMAYIFYPYYWAEKCSWKNLLQTEHAPDPIFQAFLQSGMARVTLPVRPGFEEAVMYYMETGEIWNGGDLVMESDDELYISIAEELQVIEGFVEEEWQTRVPTSLTVVQGDSVALDEGGLPCCEDGADTNFSSSPDILGVIKKENG